VDNHKKSNEQLLSRLNSVEEENKQLKLQLDSLKRQNQSLLEASNLNNKDLSFLGSNPSDTYRQDTSILVEC
jgi:cell shape-determining protein MreC